MEKLEICNDMSPNPLKIRGSYDPSPQFAKLRMTPIIR